MRYRPKIRPVDKHEQPDLERRNALVLEHLEWAYSIARSVLRGLPTWFTFEDVAGPAEIGLIQAAERYDARSGVPFRAYARLRVHGACIAAIRRREYRERGHISLHAMEFTVGVDRDTPMVNIGIERLREPGPSPEQQAMARDAEAIWLHVWQLPERHRLLIQRVYGDGLTLAEAARLTQVVESRVCQIHREALGMLRLMCEEMG